MSNETRHMLAQHVDSAWATIHALGSQIESGVYGDEWTIEDEDGNTEIVAGATEGIAAHNLRDDHTLTGEPWDWTYTHNDTDVPMVADVSIDEYPLEVVDERGREFAVILTVGGPHIEVVADGGQNPRLVGYWGGETVTRHGGHLDTFLDYFIER